MAKQPNPNRGHASSMSGPPKAFSHVKNVRSEFGRTASGEREKAPMRAKSPNLGKSFHKAHEGPREELGKPRKHHIYTLQGKVAAEVHSKIDREKQARNRQKDLQMKKWRERKAPGHLPTQKPVRDPRSKPLLKKRSPDVRLSGEKNRSVKQIMQAKQARSRGGQSR